MMWSQAEPFQGILSENGGPLRGPVAPPAAKITARTSAIAMPVSGSTNADAFRPSPLGDLGSLSLTTLFAATG
jgi:hypothetical protein